MIWSSLLPASLLLASSASAGMLSSVPMGVRRDDATERVVRRMADALIEEMIVERRQSSTTSSVNATEWDAQTTAACTTALGTLNGTASNPSGMAVCYNLPFLDNSTGVFQADLRLYKLSDPTGDFAGIQTQDVQVGLNYLGATVSPINSSELKRRDEKYSLISWPVVRSAEVLEKRQSTNSTPALSQAYAFVGQINKNLLIANLNTSSLQALLVPTVTLTGTGTSGATVQTNLSSTEATFVSGVFADQATTSNADTAAAAAASSQVQADTVFKVPGTRISIFPIGAIITGVWAILGFATIAYGTIGRMGFRDQYRRRAARAEKGGQLTI